MKHVRLNSLLVVATAVLLCCFGCFHIAHGAATNNNANKAVRCITETDEETTTSNFKKHQETRRSDDRDGSSILSIGIPIPLTGSNKSNGKQVLRGIEAALESIGDNPFPKLDVYLRDTKSDPQEAKRIVAKLYKQGVRLFIGLLTSAEAEVVVDYAKENAKDAYFLSPSSTATSLSLHDNFFRLCMNDAAQAQALISLFMIHNVTSVLPVIRNDNYGNGLWSDIMTVSSHKNGLSGSREMKILRPVKYSTKQIKDTASGLQLLQEIDSVLAVHPDANVLFVGFDEVQHVLAAITEVPLTYPANRRWYGTDSTALSSAVSASSASTLGALRTKYTATIYNGNKANSEMRLEFYRKVRKQFRDEIPSPFAAMGYDSTLLVVVAAMQTTNPKDMKQLLPYLSSFTFGLSGHLLLNAQQDRSQGDYSVVMFQGDSKLINSNFVLTHDGHSISVLSTSPWRSIGTITVVSSPVIDDRPSSSSSSSFQAAPLVVSSAASVFHMLTEKFRSISRIGSKYCDSSKTEVSFIDPITFDKVKKRYKGEIPPQLVVPATHGVDIVWTCKNPNRGTSTIKASCTGVETFGVETLCTITTKTKLNNGDTTTNQTQFFVDPPAFYNISAVPSQSSSRLRRRDSDDCCDSLPPDIIELLGDYSGAGAGAGAGTGNQNDHNGALDDFDNGDWASALCLYLAVSDEMNGFCDTVYQCGGDPAMRAASICLGFDGIELDACIAFIEQLTDCADLLPEALQSLCDAYHDTLCEHGIDCYDLLGATAASCL
eukprot:TRINITY_DN2782_c0_g1_i1.p1 TRINITY_DN2782_c0_g1~~TRINITY_DN2782_c0_g1_i1.p1  ORF type:complete len:772 (-),score=191.74 TRINITY_DN2782_c0_g1_i1:117-2432(-)